MSRCRLSFLAASVLAFGLLPTRDADAEVTRDNQIWAASFNTVRLTGRDPGETSGLSGWLDIHGRRSNSAYLSILRPGLGYRFNGHVSAWAGYAAVPSLPDSTRDWVLEQRAWQQGLFTIPFAEKLMLQLRPRLEQRFREGEEDVAHRLRAFVRLNVTPSREVPLLLATWNETFLHLNDASWGPSSGFDQNRLFLGFGVRALRTSRVEIGYLNATTKTHDGLFIAHNLSVNALSDF